MLRPHLLGRWLRAGRPDRGGLLIPGGSPPDADLLLAPDRVSVSAAGHRIDLEWAHLGEPSEVATIDAWMIGPLAWNRGNPIGIGLAVDGRYATAAGPLVTATRYSFPLAYGVGVGTTGARPRTALCRPNSLGVSTNPSDLWLVRVLCTLLAGRPDARARLADPDRVVRLLHDLDHHRHDPRRTPSGGFLRTTLEIHVAMHVLGYEHRLQGRPVPGDPAVSTDQIVAEVLARVRANPWAQGIHVSEAHVRHLVEHDYVDVEPWPFAALTVEDHLATPPLPIDPVAPPTPGATIPVAAPTPATRPQPAGPPAPDAPPPPMHEGQLPIDAGLVHRLLLTQHPELAELPIERVRSTGTVNALFRVGDDLVVRLPLGEQWAGGLRRELRWLPRLAPEVPLPVPEPLVEGEPSDDFPLPWAVYGWLDGEPWAADEEVDEAALAADLAGFVGALRRVDPAGAPAAGRAPLAPFDDATRTALASATGIDRGAALAAWEEAVRLPAWAGAPVWIHNDLLRPNLLLRDGRLGAVLDFGSCGVGDPAADVVPAWSAFTAPGRAVFRSALRVDGPTWRRARGYALHQAALIIPYYDRTNPAMAAHARRTVAQVLEDEGR